MIAIPGVRSGLAALLLALLAAPAARPQGQLYTFNISTSFQNPAGSVKSAGDVNGDGVPDLIVSGLSGNSARVFSGADGSLIHLLFGAASFGDAVSGAGDVNLDGYDDVIVGAPGDDTVNGTNAGSATVFSGLDGAALYTFLGDSAGDAFGFAVSEAGDVDFDGYPDVIVGAPMDDQNGANTGSAFVYSGFDGSLLHAFHSFSAGDNLGTSVAGAGDVDMDQHADLIVGLEDADPTGKSSGSAYVFSGQSGALLLAFNGDTGGDLMGRAVSPAGDANLDGYADVLVGSPGDSPDDVLKAGNAMVFSGFDGATLFRFDGQEIGEALGSAVADAGDVNADGYMDFLLGAPLADPNGASSGRAAVHLGTTGDLLYSLDGFSAGHYLGYSGDGAGDVNQDGFADVIVGAKASAAVYSGRSVFLPGDTLVGEIKPATDRDDVRFFAFRGMAVEMEFEVTSGSLRPELQILSGAGALLKAFPLANGGMQKRTFEAPSSGIFQIRVLGDQATSGKYRIVTRPLFPKKAFGFEKVKKAGKNQKMKGLIRALPGAVMELYVRPLKHFVNPPQVSITLPNGLSYDVSSFATVEFGNVLHLAGVPLLEVGFYELTVFGESKKSKARIELEVEQPLGSATVPID